MARALSKHGLVVRVAPSALHAIYAIEAWHGAVKVVLADQNMPGPSGLLLLETVERRWPHVRRMLMSGDLPGKLVNTAESAQRILDKSYPLSQIVEAVIEELHHAEP